MTKEKKKNQQIKNKNRCDTNIPEIECLVT